MIQCKNPLIVQSYNVVMLLNDWFSKYPNESLTKEDFMELQKHIWKEVKKEFNIHKGEEK